MNHRVKTKRYIKLIGRRLERIRKDRKKTLNEVGQAVGISRRTLRRIEKGEVDWNLLTAAAICKYYKISMSELLAEDDHRS